MRKRLLMHAGPKLQFGSKTLFSGVSSTGGRALNGSVPVIDPGWMVDLDHFASSNAILRLSGLDHMQQPSYAQKALPAKASAPHTRSWRHDLRISIAVHCGNGDLPTRQSDAMAHLCLRLAGVHDPGSNLVDRCAHTVRPFRSRLKNSHSPASPIRTLPPRRVLS